VTTLTDKQACYPERSEVRLRDARTTTRTRRLPLLFQRASVSILLTLVLLAGSAGPLGAAEEPLPSALQLEYRLILTHPNLHLVTVEITAGQVSGEFLDFVMPAWAPGRYAVYDFAKNVQEFEAEGAQGQALPGPISISRLGESTSAKPGAASRRVTAFSPMTSAGLFLSLTTRTLT